ncbi:Putative membrane protein [Zobellia galactanivorans]|uniref:Putative membrane protein n=1 Tax=Zobellia galactanivorans (strain DSM 12802 / CCUG 47099 / CIP 106680 / NCIMB 13871 / Dsij) TaxID=63186 RepID=G0L0I1_ZOBGA|nr:Putative membrane protein [Zobellia galactanivorans]
MRNIPSFILPIRYNMRRLRFNLSLLFHLSDKTAIFYIRCTCCATMNSINAYLLGSFFFFFFFVMRN